MLYQPADQYAPEVRYWSRADTACNTYHDMYYLLEEYIFEEFYKREDILGK